MSCENDHDIDGDEDDIYGDEGDDSCGDKHCDKVKIHY